MGKTLSLLVLLSLSIQIYAGEAASQIKNNILQNAYSYGDSVVETWARDNLKSLRLIRDKN